MAATRRRRAMLDEEAAAAALPEGAAAGEDENDDEDEAPEEVTFERARAAAEAERRRAGETARRDRELLKEKRRRREELFKDQKKRKLLPENILEELTSRPQINNKLSDTNKQGQNVGDGSQNKHEEHARRRNKERKKPVVRIKGSYMAVRLKDQDITSQHQQMAKDFVQKHLYGPGTNRTTANQFFSFANKKSPVKKAAVQFVNKSWGLEKKQKAKQFKKHWMATKNGVSCVGGKKPSPLKVDTNLLRKIWALS
ncbi:U3 small nucleolar RNA-associated protein NOL7 [Carettochelys insculpta]|uniref:U3 small nucleolar RNA-associated protein NOL7 n=1 Tax=Carettochelys insculpta TaxID=44489 RepID=UPI003EBB9A77